MGTCCGNNKRPQKQNKELKYAVNEQEQQSQMKEQSENEKNKENILLSAQQENDDKNKNIQHSQKQVQQSQSSQIQKQPLDQSYKQPIEQSQKQGNNEASIQNDMPNVYEKQKNSESPLKNQLMMSQTQNKMSNSKFEPQFIKEASKNNSLMQESVKEQQQLDDCDIGIISLEFNYIQGNEDANINQMNYFQNPSDKLAETYDIHMRAIIQNINNEQTGMFQIEQTIPEKQQDHYFVETWCVWGQVDFE